MGVAITRGTIHAGSYVRDVTGGILRHGHYKVDITEHDVTGGTLRHGHYRVNITEHDVTGRLLREVR